MKRMEAEGQGESCSAWAASLSCKLTFSHFCISRLDILLPIARRFVNEYFEQNPIGQLAILLMRDGITDRLVPMGGNTSDHLAALSNKRRLEPRGDPSLQNALEMAKSTLAHLPTTSSREVLLLSGSLTSCDPGNIHQTIASLKASRIRVDLIHLTAEMKIMRDIARETGGTFGVALDDHHLEELVREGIAPREIIKKEEAAPRVRRGGGDEESDEDDEAGAELMQMGFPLRLPTHAPPSLCACHSRLFPPSTSSATSSSAGSSRPSNKHSGAGSGFLCPRCNSKICDVPTDCPTCGLTVVMSTHLARSYRHLFPVKPFRGVSWER
jgi:transcription initiation factor TFIIH subunit 2